jgi:hypothetical protein
MFSSFCFRSLPPLFIILRLSSKTFVPSTPNVFQIPVKIRVGLLALKIRTSQNLQPHRTQNTVSKGIRTGLENVGASTSPTLWAPTDCCRESFTILPYPIIQVAYVVRTRSHLQQIYTYMKINSTSLND